MVGFRPQNFDTKASSAKNWPFRSVWGEELAREVDTEELDASAAAVANRSPSSTSRAPKTSSSNASFDFFFFWSIHRCSQLLLAHYDLAEEPSTLLALKSVLSPILATRKFLRGTRGLLTACEVTTRLVLPKQKAFLNMFDVSVLSAERGKFNLELLRESQQDFFLARFA